jgi:hypothetical protein
MAYKKLNLKTALSDFVHNWGEALTLDAVARTYSAVWTSPSRTAASGHHKYSAIRTVSGHRLAWG